MTRYGLFGLLLALAVIGFAGWALFRVTIGLIDVLLFFALIAAVSAFHRNGPNRGPS